MLVTKRDKPLVVVLDYDRYIELTKAVKHKKNKRWIDKTFGIIKEEDTDNLLDDIQSSRVNNEINLWS